MEGAGDKGEETGLLRNMLLNQLSEGKHQEKRGLHRTKTKTTMVPMKALRTQCHRHPQLLSPHSPFALSNGRHGETDGRLYVLIFYFFQKHVRENLQCFPEINRIVETEHDTKGPHCPALVC